MPIDWEEVARRNMTGGNPPPSTPSSQPNWDEVAKRNVTQPPPQEDKNLLEKAWDWEKDQVTGAVGAGRKLAENVGKGNIFTDENAKLAAETINKGGAALLPALPVAVGAGIASAGVVPTLATLGMAGALGYAGGKTARKGAELVGAGEGVQDLAEAVGGNLAGGAGVVKGFNRVAAARGAAKAAATPAEAEVSKIVSGRDFDANDLSGVLRQRGQTPRSFGEGVDSLMSKAVDAEWGTMKRLREMAQRSGASKQAAREAVHEIENQTAIARRPDAPQVEMVERLGFENKVRAAADALKDVKGADPKQIASAYMIAKRENAEVAAGNIDPTMLKGGSRRVVENQKILDLYGDKLEPLAQSLNQMGKEALDYMVKTGIKSPAEAAKLSQRDFWVPFRRVTTETERSAADLMKEMDSPRVLGKGDKELVNYLSEDLSRESLDPIQGMLDYVQTVFKLGSRNQALVKVAENANWLTKNGVQKKGQGLFEELTVVPGTANALGKLPPQMKGQVGSVPVWIGGKEHQLVGDPSFIKAVENWGSLAIDVANPFMATVQSLMRGQARVFKMATTGVLAPQRKLVNTAYNYLQLYQQMPLEVTAGVVKDSVKFAFEFFGKEVGEMVPEGVQRMFPGLKKALTPSQDFKNVRTESLKGAAAGSSTEIIRGEGEKNIGLLMAKADPLNALPKYAILDPIREVGKAAKGQKYNPEIISQFKTTLDDTMRKFEDIVTADETGFRMAVFKRVNDYYLKQGRSPEQAKELALFDARNVITDFSRRGTWSKYYDFVGQQYAQAATTGTLTNLRYLQRDPAGFVGRSMVPWLTHLAVTQAQYGDPEKRKILMDISLDTQAKNIVLIPDASKVTKNEEGRYNGGIIVIPQPESSVSRIMNLVNVGVGQRLSDKENAADFVSLSLIGAKHLFPMELNPLVAAANIPIAGPLAEVAVGRSAQGFPIYSERAKSRVDKELPDVIRNSMDALGADKKTKIGANYLLQRGFPVLRAYNQNSPQSGEAPKSQLRQVLDTMAMPFTSAPGGAIKRKEREEKYERRINR